MNTMLKIMVMLLISAVTLSVQAAPEKDLEVFHNFFKQKFPDTPTAEFANGVYAFDKAGRENWEAIEEFPPYEPFIDDGEEMWNTAFKNGKTYKDCFPDGPVIAHKYPYWDKKQKMVMTLPLALNQCRKANAEKPLKYKKGDINKIMSFLAYQARGKKVNVVIPAGDPDAMAAYEEGKKFYFTRRGQLNFACAHCHFQNAGLKIRSEMLSAAQGHTTHFPVYRSKWGTVGTLHRRFTGCNKQVRAKPFKAQGREYRNLEYFLTHMSNGLTMNGPGARK